MHSPISYIIAASVGLVLAFLLTHAQELRRLRMFQLVFIPAAFAGAVAVLPDPAAGYSSVGSLMGFFAILGFVAITLAPNIAYTCGAVLSNFLDPMDWTPTEQEIALRPIKKLIDKDRYQDALTELQVLLKKHKPTYEALLLKAKLLHQFQRFNETGATLLRMIPLSNTTQQQLVVMDLLAALEPHQPGSRGHPAPGVRQMGINHELVLFELGSSDRSIHKVIQPGNYSVTETLVGTHRWLVLKDEPWGNAESCWQAVRETGSAKDSPQKKGFLYRIAHAQQSLVAATKGKSRLQAQHESRALHKEAARFIRQENWAAALPLLQKASDEDPDNYEIAYHLVQAAQQVSPSSNPGIILSKVLAQSNWTEDQEHMLKQLIS